MLRIFFYIHLAGLLLIGTGLSLLLLTDITSEVSGMIMASSALGLGAVAISPYPVIKFIAWSQKQSSSQE
jgi:hypothetical protein